MPKRSYDGKFVMFDPSRTKKDIHNTFRGFDVEALPVVPDDEVEELSASIHKYILTVVCRGDVKAAKGLTDWLAYLFKHPGLRSKIAPLLYGALDCKLEEFVQWVGVLIGSRYTAHILGKTKSKRKQNFNEKLLIHDTTVSDSVKGYIRDQEYLWDAHCYLRVDSYHNVIFTTSNRAVAAKACENWKIGVFSCVACEDYEVLKTQMLDPRVQLAFYQSLLKRDLSTYLIGWANDFVSVLRTEARGVTV